MNDEKKPTLEIPTYLDKPEPQAIEKVSTTYGGDDMIYAMVLTCFLTVAMCGLGSVVYKHHQHTKEMDATNYSGGHPKLIHIPFPSTFACLQDNCGVLRYTEDKIRQWDFETSDWDFTLSSQYPDQVKKVDYVWVSSYWDRAIEKTVLLTDRSKWDCNKARKELAEDYSDQYVDVSYCVKVFSKDYN